MELDCVIKEQIRDDAQTDVYLKNCRAKYLKVVNKTTGTSVICTSNPDPNLAQSQIAVVKELGDSLQVGPRQPLHIEEIDENSVQQHTLKNVWVRMSNQYTSRISMLLMRKAMISRSYFLGQIVDYEKHIWKCRIHRLTDGEGEEVTTGIMNEDTRLCFLSQSAKMFILLQVSQELVDMGEDELKLFLCSLFEKWKEAEASHVVSIIAFARSHGQDYYRVIIDWDIQAEFSTSLEYILVSLKAFIAELKNITSGKSGNILEAVNMVLQNYDRHHLDRDLTRTGLSIVVVSACDGVFEVDQSLMALTKRRCCDLGVWLQLVLLGNKPSQVAPLFLLGPTEGIVPHWIDCDYFDTGLGPSTEIIESVSIVDEECNDCALKWDLYPPLKYDPNMDSQFGWESLITPPCLPLRSKAAATTDFNPELYNVSSYEVFPSVSSPFLEFGNNTTEYEKLAMIANELMLLRLNQNYQVIDVKRGLLVVSHGHSFQTIKYSKKTSFITVTIYKWKNSSYKLSHDYHYMLKSSQIEGFHKHSVTFATEEDYKWELMDNLLVGNDLKDEDFAGLWKSRFILIPATIAPSLSGTLFSISGEFSESDIRLAAFSRFMNFVTSKFTKQETEESVMTRLGITATTATLSSHLNDLMHLDAPLPLVDNMQRERKKSFDMVPLTKESTLQEVVSMMQDPNIGLNISRRTWFFSTYDKSFIGAEALDWIMKFYSDVNCREEAFQVANNLMKDGVWEHVNLEHDFIDGHFYYRFTQQYEEGQSRPVTPVKRSVVEVSRKLRLNLDDSTERSEWLMMHNDTIHNPKIAFHFQIQWINCSSRLLDSLIHSWCNKARMLGFSLIEVPVQPPRLVGPSPFEQAIPIILAAQPPSVPFIAHHRETLLIEEFLVHHHFVLDLEPDTHFPSNPGQKYFKRSTPRPPVDHLQYVCRAGSAIVQIVRDQVTKQFSFLWSRNKLALVNPVQTKEKATTLSEFQALCGNQQELHQFWNNLVHELTINPSSLKSVL